MPHCYLFECRTKRVMPCRELNTVVIVSMFSFVSMPLLSICLCLSEILLDRILSSIMSSMSIEHAIDSPSKHSLIDHRSDTTQADLVHALESSLYKTADRDSQNGIPMNLLPAGNWLLCSANSLFGQRARMLHARRHDCH